MWYNGVNDTYREGCALTMGERIRQARLEAGLSQRELAGEMMTRNMLSALEHDGAKPSVASLVYLSEKLCKPIGYFFGEEPPWVPEAGQMAQARAAYGRGDWQGCLDALKGLNEPDFQAEQGLLRALSVLYLAEEAEQAGRMPYARELLRQARQTQSPYFPRELERRRLVLEARTAVNPSQKSAIAAQIPMEEQVLELKAECALADGDGGRAVALLEAMENHSGNRWNWLRGEVHFAAKEYAAAAKCYHRAEEAMPFQTRQRLEICYREMEDYKMAYYYATKQ